MSYFIVTQPDVLFGSALISATEIGPLRGCARECSRGFRFLPFRRAGGLCRGA